jgi:hypothetical protein
MPMPSTLCYLDCVLPPYCCVAILCSALALQVNRGGMGASGHLDADAINLVLS